MGGIITQRVAIGAMLALVCLAAWRVPVATADVLGVSVNGTCEVGSCPAQPTGFGTSNSTPFSFDFTLANGDVVNFTGNIASDDSSDGLTIHNNGGFVATYVSGPNGISQTDNFGLIMYYSFHMGVASGMIDGSQGISGSFGAGVANGSSVEFDAFNGNTDILTLGPFINPTNNPFFDTGSFHTSFSGSEFDFLNLYTVNFAAGTQAGCSISANGGPSSCPSLPTVPEPGSLPLLGAALLLMAVLSARESGFQIEG